MKSPIEINRVLIVKNRHKICNVKPMALKFFFVGSDRLIARLYATKDRLISADETVIDINSNISEKKKF